MNPGIECREYWIDVMLKIVDPVLNNLKNRQLKLNMPIEGLVERYKFAHLEAMGRTLVGMAPWLETPIKEAHEEEIRLNYAALAREAIDAGTDPNSPDYMNFTEGKQPLVDAAFLSHAILRAPNELWNKLDGRVKKNLIDALKNTRRVKPNFSNWLLFSAMVEAVLFVMGEEYDPMRVDYAIKQHMQWYKGDGIYGDGPDFHWDYYNSFVIQPMLVDVINTLGDEDGEWNRLKKPVMERACRYAEVLERLISPEGTFPPIGRSLPYRFGAFQLLSQMALQNNLPEGVSPAQVRSGLTAVIKRVMEQPGNFDDGGWLRMGFCGSQPDIAEEYLCTGSLYLCSTVFLPLGLSPEDEFWRGKDEDWTSKKVWSGHNIYADHAVI